MQAKTWIGAGTTGFVRRVYRQNVVNVKVELKTSPYNVLCTMQDSRDTSLILSLLRSLMISAIKRDTVHHYFGILQT